MKVRIGGGGLPKFTIEEMIALDSRPTAAQARGLGYDEYLEILGKWMEAKLYREIAKIRAELKLGEGAKS